MIHNFSLINPVPQYKELIDIALSKTNRKTPTVIHPGYEIQRIRSFYIRKIKHASDEFTKKLEEICKGFPVLDDLHPFYSDLIGVLYDKDHFKIALGQVNSTKSKIERVKSEHLKIIKFGDSLYRCKQLKKAALGRMASNVKKLAEPLKYLEEVRQHLSRLPSIDTSSRSIIICGYPNVGKSSFMNKVTNAHVDVQPYAFTTKSIYIGHFEYESLQWQILDTPGILDHLLEDRNVIEMQTIVALAHLKSAVLFFMDLSETCGFSIENQISLYEGLTPLLNSQVLILLSKSDLQSLKDCQNDKILLNFLENKKYVEISSLNDFNVMEARNTICEMLLSERVVEKQDKLNGFVHRIKPIIPEIINQKTASVHLGVNPILTMPERESYFCQDKYDIIPEIYNGKNIADFVDENILEKFNEVKSQNHHYNLREFDVMTPDERMMYEDCNNARIHANMMSIFNKRASVPKHRKNPEAAIQVAKPIDADTLKRHKERSTAIVKESRNKKVQKNYGAKFANSNPRHLVRPTKSKFSSK